MKNLIAAFAIALTLTTLAGCEALQTLAPAIAGARNCAFACRKLPAGTTLATAKRWMEIRAAGPDADQTPGDSAFNNAETMLASESEWYSGNKAGNSAAFRLRAIPQELNIQTRDAITSHIGFPDHIGPTGITISVLPLPQVGRIITRGELHFFMTEDDQASAEYVNVNDANSYFRLQLDSLDMVNNVAAGSFEGLVVAESGEHAGEIFAITNGEFLMDIRN